MCILVITATHPVWTNLQLVSFSARY